LQRGNHRRSLHHGCQDQAHPPWQDPQSPVPHRRRRRAHRRDGRSIEVIGRYHPKEEPSLIEIDSERAQYWLGVGAQPTEPVLQLLKITGDWQKFKGLPGAEGTLKVKEPKPSKLDLFNAALAEAEGGPSTEATTPKKKKAPAKKAAKKAGDDADQKAVEAEATADPSGAKNESEPAAEGADATTSPESATES
jgi:small subunit ribosomal protein S16